jgi:hypothetical protein
MGNKKDRDRLQELVGDGEEAWGMLASKTNRRVEEMLYT